MSPILLLADSQLGLPPLWEFFVGRLHPMLVHFPVALLMLALLLELWGLRKRGPVPSSSALPCLVFGALGAVAAGLSGWLLHEHDDPGRGVADLLQWHEWLGIAVAVGAPVAAVLALSGRKGQRPRAVEASRFILCFVCLFLGIGGSLGGKMVHGREYVSGPLWQALGWSEGEASRSEPAAPEPADASVEAPGDAAAHDALTDAEPTADAADAAAADSLPPIDFVRDVAPIFVAHCVECHGAAKTKGDLRLDLPLDEGDSPRVIVPGQPFASELLTRVSLPPEDLDVMPAKGDVLSAEQIATLKRWIEQGAVWAEGEG
ncbi:MAG: hypothetical protein DRQ55_12285 [Planctomycetota bacterium]|nr:MAG: hypothetical protein DRQ55_12285 [Planctomycetota bacterium]